MKKKIKVYYTPVEIEVELDDDLAFDEIEQEINRQIYDIRIDEINQETCIDYWEEE